MIDRLGIGWRLVDEMPAWHHIRSQYRQL
jgi:hypothetical protein